MDILVVSLLVFITTIFVFNFRKRVRKTDLESLNNEIASDFAEEYGLQENGELSSTSMNELVDWAEEESMQRKIEQVSVIKKV
tara:strand:- start:496 stop:744 length:249 start_codon:yes stop_codon:yes gene_type:complete